MALSPLDEELMSLFRYVSQRAIMPRWRNLAGDEVGEKAKDDPVTIADRETEQFLTEALQKLAPGVAVVGEEACHADPAIRDRLAGDCWIIDPIDGTRNFARGEGHFAIMLALAQAGMPVASWIYDPRRDRLCHARTGEGAFVDGESVKAAPSGQSPATLAAMKGYMADEQRALFETEIEPHYAPVEAPGCAGEQYPLTVWGGHDIALYERTEPWDHAPGCLFLNEAGGKCARPDGSPYRVDDARRGLIGAVSPSLFDEFAQRLQAAGYTPAA
jgi:fructose-1,6-bisphosphatase/inositol monophosphatase family enzyme